jgi:SEC-C motif-containing protein
MRSRFSAFAVGEAGYLRETWHPSTRPDRVELDERRSWTRLEIIDAVEGGPFDSTGVVEFRAHHRIDGVRAVLRERSSFVRVDGRWYYVSGEVKEG